MSRWSHFNEQEQSILQMRAERVARRGEDGPVQDVLSALTVSFHDEVYALPVECLMNIYTDIQIVPVPCTPDYVSGVVNVRGRLIPVFDLAYLVGSSINWADSWGVVVVASDGETTLALRVMAIGDLVVIPLDATENGLPANEENYLQAVFPDGMALVNVKAILNDPRLVVNDRNGGA